MHSRRAAARPLLYVSACRRRSLLVFRPWLGVGRGCYPVKSRARRRRRPRGTRRAGAAAASRGASSGASPSLLLPNGDSCVRRDASAACCCCAQVQQFSLVGLEMRCADKTRGFCKSQWCFVKCRVLRGQRLRGAVAFNDSQCAAKCALQPGRSRYYYAKGRSQCDEWTVANATRLFAQVELESQGL